MDIVSVDYTTEEAEVASKGRVERMVAYFQEYSNLVQEHSETAGAIGGSNHNPNNVVPMPMPMTAGGGRLPGKERRPATGVGRQMSVLVRRAMLCIVRDRFLLIGGIVEASLLALLIGAIFYNMGKDDSLTGLKSRLAMLYPSG